MKTARALILTLTTLSSLSSIAMSDSDYNLPRGYRISPDVDQLISDLTRAEAARLESQRQSEALDMLKVRIERHNAQVKAELDKMPMSGRVAACNTFVFKTRYQAAPLHQRLRDLTTDKLSESQTAGLTPKQKEVAQGWVDFAKKNDRASFVGAFSPDSCTQRLTGMTDEKAESALRATATIIMKIERSTEGSL